VKDADPNGPTSFPFSGSLGSFELVDDGGAQGSRTFAGLAPGTFTVTESATTGWTLDSITCLDPTNDSTGSVLAGTATIALGSGESVVCTFRNSGPVVVPPLPPRPELPTTGSAIGIPALLTGLALLGVGLVLSRASRRRQAA
jgi:LPXTG-motif cell wall-anchored protein